MATAPDTKETTAPSPAPRQVVAHDTSPAIISDHPFEPRGEWWSLCKHCGLAQPAHNETTPAGRPPFHYHSDDNPDD
jgi:hypothetical protein